MPRGISVGSSSSIFGPESFASPRQVVSEQALFGLEDLGLTEQQGLSWFSRGNAAVARFDQINAKANQALGAIPQAMKEVISFLGDARNTRSPIGRRTAVGSDLAIVASFPQANRAAGAKFFYEEKRRRDRIVELEAWNSKFDAKVNNLISKFNVVFVPQEVPVPVPVPGPAPEPKVVVRTQEVVKKEVDTTTLLLVGGGALVAGVLLFSLLR